MYFIKKSSNIILLLTIVILQGCCNKEQTASDKQMFYQLLNNSDIGNRFTYDSLWFEKISNTLRTEYNNGDNSTFSIYSYYDKYRQDSLNIIVFKKDGVVLYYLYEDPGYLSMLSKKQSEMNYNCCDTNSYILFSSLIENRLGLKDFINRIIYCLHMNENQAQSFLRFYMKKVMRFTEINDVNATEIFSVSKNSTLSRIDKLDSIEIYNAESNYSMLDKLCKEKQLIYYDQLGNIFYVIFIDRDDKNNYVYIRMKRINQEYYMCYKW